MCVHRSWRIKGLDSSKSSHCIPSNEILNLATLKAGISNMACLKHFATVGLVANTEVGIEFA
jgi:hypothetical protein